RSARQDTESMHIQGGIIGNLQIPSEFVGYEQLQVSTTVTAIIKDGELVEQAVAGDKIEILLAETPFYAESGGQIADKGHISAAGVSVHVTEVQKAPNGQNLHTAVIKEGTLENGIQVLAQVDKMNRKKIEKNHTATHLLHQALK